MLCVKIVLGLTVENFIFHTAVGFDVCHNIPFVKQVQLT